jgi:ATP-dependent helicase/nuclease subunit B
MEKYASCPFAYYVMYNLKARERKVYEVHPVELGVLYHEVIEAFTKKVAEEGTAWRDLSRDGVTRLVTESIDALVSDPANVLHSTARNRYILQKVKRICAASAWALSEHIKRGGFTPSAVEVDFSPESDMPMPQLKLEDGRRLLLTGRIDRVDVMRTGDADYIKIIDYKSGAKRFDLSEVEAGTQLQLILYMNALLTGARLFINPKPGGLFYFHLDDPVLSSDSPLDRESREQMLLECFRMSGLALDDAASGIDGGLRDGGRSSVIPVSVNADGSWSKASSVADLAFFEKLGKLVEEKIKTLSTRMINGIITPEPVKLSHGSACDFCRYDGVCSYSVAR